MSDSLPPFRISLAASLISADKSALSEFLHQTLLVLRGTAQVRAWLRFVRCKLCRLRNIGIIQLLPAQKLFRFASLHRRCTNIGQTYAHLLTNSLIIHRELRSDRSRSKVADLSLKLYVCTPAAWRRNWNANLSHNLVVLQLRCKQRDKEALNGQHSLALWSDCHDLRSECQHRSRMVVRRVAMRQIACQRRHIPYLRIGDHTSLIKEDGVLRANQWRML